MSIKPATTVASSLHPVEHYYVREYLGIEVDLPYAFDIDRLFESYFQENEILDMLGEEGFVYNIKRLAAFIACTEPGNTHSPAFMIFRKCKKESVIEFIGIRNPCHTMEAACL